MAAHHLILVGGGHSHALVLKSLAERGEPQVELSVVSPQPHTTYSGMVPGVIGGQYALHGAQIDVARLTARAHGTFVAAGAVSVDAQRRVLILSDGRQLAYDLLSFDIGAQAKPPPAASDSVRIIALKPIENAIAALETALAAPDAGGAQPRIVIVGAGAGGSEVALALAARLRRAHRGTVTVCDEVTRPVLERGPRTAALVERAFAAAGITFAGGSSVEQVTRSGVRLRDQRELPADLVVWATGAGAPALFKASGLPVDARGFLAVNGDLRCAGVPQIFAAGDCATISTHPDLPKAGVYAVREAPILTHNLRAARRGDSLRTFAPQPRFLSLLNTADGRAILSYGGFAWHSRWAWWLKDRIDRGFIAQFAK